MSTEGLILMPAYRERIDIMPPDDARFTDPALPADFLDARRHRYVEVCLDIELDYVVMNRPVMSRMAKGGRS